MTIIARRSVSVTYSAIGDKWHALQAAGVDLGAPDGNGEQAAYGGRIAYFQGGVIYAPNDGGEAMLLATDPSGRAWVINGNREVFSWDGGWKAQDCAAAADGSTWFVGNDNPDGAGNQLLFYWKDGRLNQEGAGVRLALGPGDDVWVVNAALEVFRYDHGWVKMPSARGTGGDFNAVWILDRAWLDEKGDSAVLRWEFHGAPEHDRVRITGGWASEITTGTDGKLWMVKADHSVYICDPDTISGEGNGTWVYSPVGSIWASHRASLGSPTIEVRTRFGSKENWGPEKQFPNGHAWFFERGAVYQATGQAPVVMSYDAPEMGGKQYVLDKIDLLGNFVDSYGFVATEMVQGADADHPPHPKGDSAWMTGLATIAFAIEKDFTTTAAFLRSLINNGWNAYGNYPITHPDRKLEPFTIDPFTTQMAACFYAWKSARDAGNEEVQVLAKQLLGKFIDLVNQRHGKLGPDEDTMSLGLSSRIVLCQVAQFMGFEQSRIDGLHDLITQEKDRLRAVAAGMTVLGIPAGALGGMVAGAETFAAEGGAAGEQVLGTVGLGTLGKRIGEVVAGLGGAAAGFAAGAVAGVAAVPAGLYMEKVLSGTDASIFATWLNIKAEIVKSGFRTDSFDGLTRISFDPSNPDEMSGVHLLFWETLLMDECDRSAEIQEATSHLADALERHHNMPFLWLAGRDQEPREWVQSWNVDEHHAYVWKQTEQQQQEVDEGDVHPRTDFLILRRLFDLNVNRATGPGVTGSVVAGVLPIDTSGGDAGPATSTPLPASPAQVDTGTAAAGTLAIDPNP